MPQETILSRRKWFNQSDILLHPLHQLNSGRGVWTIQTLNISNDPDDSDVVVLRENTDALYTRTRQQVERQIADYTITQFDFEAFNDAANELRVANNTRLEWNTGRQSSKMRKSHASMQNTLQHIGEFLKGFSGIADIVKAADQTFGGLAYGTISLLVTVAVNKQNREETFEAALDELAFAFPRLGILQTLQPSGKLRCLIITAFEQSVVFCREAIIYFSRRSRRLKDALSPQHFKTQSLENLRKTLREVRNECDIMMIRMVSDMSKQMEALRHQLGDVEETGLNTNFSVKRANSILIRMDQSTDKKAKNDLLSKTQQFLALNKQDCRPALDIIIPYKAILAREFSEQRRKGRLAQQMTGALLEQEKQFTQWKEGAFSSLLLLGGSNLFDDSSVQLNWLSVASIWALENMADDFSVTASFFCQTNYTVTKRMRRQFSDIMRSLIYQLAQQHTNCLEDFQEEIRDMMDIFKRSDYDVGEAAAEVLEYMHVILKSFEANTSVLIIIDRLDQCYWHDDLDTARHNIETVVCALLALVHKDTLPNLRIKILLVMDEMPAQKLAQHFRHDRSKGSFDYKIDWHQGQDDG